MTTRTASPVFRYLGHIKGRDFYCGLSKLGAMTLYASSLDVPGAKAGIALRSYWGRQAVAVFGRDYWNYEPQPETDPLADFGAQP